ncbi:Ubiquitin family/Tir chaperone protein (CesT) family [Lotmaria passim]
MMNTAYGEDGSTGEGTPARCFYVLSDVDGYKYKLILQGELHQLTVRRIKKYLQKAAGVAAPQQLLTFNGNTLHDDMSGEEVGLFDGAILRLQQAAPNASEDLHSSCSHSDGHRPANGPAADVGSMATSCLLQRVTRHHVGSSRDRARCTALLPQSYSLVESTVMPASTLTGGVAATTAEPSPPQQLPPSTAPCKHISGTSDKSRDVGNVTSPLIANLGPVKEVGHTMHGDAQTYCRALEARVATLSIENVRLREQLHVVARQAAEANGSADWKNEEEIAQLKAALAAARRATTEADEAATQRWRVKEEELVRELDLLREERRRLRDDAAGQEAKLQELLHSMEGEIRSLKYELREKEEALQTTRLSLAGLKSQQDQSSRGDQATSSALLPLSGSIDVLAEQALTHLSYFLATPVPLQLDPENDTCVVPLSDTLNMLVTLDRETEHLYLYVALLDKLPASPVQRMRLYEMLLQGALLGKDMAGGGAGLSTESNLILMSISADLRHNGALALAAAAPSFVKSAQLWRKMVDELLCS